MTDPLDELRQALPAGYELVRPVSAGGQGAVFLGKKSGVLVAMKLFEAPDAERLRREVDLLVTISSRYLPALLDFQLVQFKGRQFPMIAYEYIDGPDLRVFVSRPENLDGVQICTIGEHVGEALEVLWTHRIVHRDVKPANIIAGRDGRYVLVDVGIAQHLDLSTITRGGQPGTDGYRSPEQCGGRSRLTIHSDVFSLGTTIFEVASHRHPWDGDQARMLYDDPAQLGVLRTDLDRRLVALVEEMLSRHPGRRPAKPGARFNSLRSG
jgi:serine/threonine-protein kinase